MNILNNVDPGVINFAHMWHSKPLVIILFLPIMQHCFSRFCVIRVHMCRISDCDIVSYNYSHTSWSSLVEDQRYSPPSLVFSKAKIPVMEQSKHYWMSWVLLMLISKKMWAPCLNSSLGSSLSYWLLFLLWLFLFYFHAIVRKALILCSGKLFVPEVMKLVRLVTHLSPYILNSTNVVVCLPFQVQLFWNMCYWFEYKACWHDGLSIIASYGEIVDFIWRYIFYKKIEDNAS